MFTIWAVTAWAILWQYEVALSTLQEYGPALGGSFVVIVVLGLYIRALNRRLEAAYAAHLAALEKAHAEAMGELRAYAERGWTQAATWEAQAHDLARERHVHGD